jgi:two-component system sensor histidine kinase GlrK
VTGTENLYQRISADEMNRVKMKEAVDDFIELSDMAKSLDAQGAALVDREVDAMQRVAEKAERIVVWQLLALLPVALFLVLGFAALIAKPIRQIDEAIRHLGEGKFSKKITVDGPQDLEHLGKQLDWLRLRLVELEEQKTKFLRHVSHELKTPLTALREGAELLSDELIGPLNGEQREITVILRHNSVRLQRLIEDLLNYHAVQFQKTDLNLSSVHIKSIITTVADAQRLALLTKNSRLELACPDIILEADAEKLRIVVDNLVSNAIKFSPAGGRIRIAVRQRDGNVVLDVTDSGPGIAAEDQDKVFDAFYQGQIKHAGHVKGTGLGLSIAREYTIAHHGTIEIVDNPAGGAHFRVTLPKARAEALA